MRRWLAAAAMTILGAGPLLTPEQAAAVMARLKSPANMTGVTFADGPKVWLVPDFSSMPILYPVMRLDGTPLWQPPRVYGGRGLRGTGTGTRATVAPIKSVKSRTP